MYDNRDKTLDNHHAPHHVESHHESISHGHDVNHKREEHKYNSSHDVGQWTHGHVEKHDEHMEKHHEPISHEHTNHHEVHKKKSGLGSAFESAANKVEEKVVHHRKRVTGAFGVGKEWEDEHETNKENHDEHNHDENGVCVHSFLDSVYESAIKEVTERYQRAIKNQFANHKGGSHL